MAACETKMPTIDSIRDSKLLDRRIKETPRQKVLRECQQEGTRFRMPRTGSLAGGFVQLRVRALPSFRFKVRGSDLRCDLRIKPERAVQGGVEMVQGMTGALLRVPIPRAAGRHEIVRVPGEGLPKPRGGRGDLLVRITYRVELRVTRPSHR